MIFNIVTENFVGYMKRASVRADIFGGAEIILYDLCKMLLAGNHSVTVLQYGTENREFEFDGIPIRQIKAPHPPIDKLGLTRRFHYGGFFWKGKLDRNVDRVHFHYYYLAYPFGTEEMTGFSHGIDWDCPWHWRGISLRKLRDRFSFRLMQHITGRVVERLGRIIANDTNFFNYVAAKHPALKEKVIVVPNYVDVNIFNPHVKPDEDIMNRFGDKIRVLLPKMPAYERGTDIAIRAMAMLKRDDVVLLIVGESAGRPVFEQMARDCNIAHKVFFLGHRNHFSEMPGVYSAADIVIVPSPCREATAFAVLEAMATGKPVVACRIGGIPEIVSDDSVGVLVTPDEAALAKAILRLANDGEERMNLGSSARVHIAHKFTRDIWIASISSAMWTS
jgi:glycosyltransferase involved in cell wall biosynthesis